MEGGGAEGRAEQAGRLARFAVEAGRHQILAAQRALRGAVRGWIRAELDALDVPRAHEHGDAARSPLAPRTEEPIGPTRATLTSDDPTPDGELLRAGTPPEILAVRLAMERGFETLSVRIRELAAEVAEVRDEVIGVGRASRRDIERVRNELTETEAALRLRLEFLADTLAPPPPAPEIEAMHPSVEAAVASSSDGVGRSGRIGTPVWSRHEGPDGIVDLSEPDPDEPALAVTDLRPPRIPRRR